MSKKKKLRQIVDNPARKRLEKKFGLEKLRELEEMILKEEHAEKVILETPTRARLRQKLGQEELDRIESAFLKRK